MSNNFGYNNMSEDCNKKYSCLTTTEVSGLDEIPQADLNSASCVKNNNKIYRFRKK